MPIQIRNLSIKQKFKGINPIQLKRLNFLDTTNILSSDLKNLICNFKFSINYQEINNLRNKIKPHLYNVDMVLKIINNFIKFNIKKKFLIINFELYHSDLIIEVRNNVINLYYEDFKKDDSLSERDDSLSENDEFDILEEIEYLNY